MLKIDEKLCIGCGICEDNCPFGAIQLEGDKAVVGDNCTLCGSCVEQCEPQALIMPDLSKVVQTDMESWNGVWVYCEFRKGQLATVSLELLGAGRALADQRGVKLGAVLIGGNTGETDKELIKYGADVVYKVEHESLTDFSEETYSKILSYLVKEHKPEIVLAGATAIGRSFIPGVATVLDAGLTADCTKLEIRESDGALLQTRPAFGGNIMATIVCESSRPQMATVRSKVMKPLQADESGVGEVIEVSPDANHLESRIKVLETVASEGMKVNIQESDILYQAAGE